MWRRLLYGLLHFPLFAIVSVIPVGYVLAMNVPSDKLFYKPAAVVLHNSMVVAVLNLSVNELVRPKAVNFLARLFPTCNKPTTTDM